MTIKILIKSTIEIITLMWFTVLAVEAYAQSFSIGLQTGDIIFHQSKSAQSTSIQKATLSPYSHMGLVVQRNQQFWVLEAIQPVQYTPIKKWIERGEQHHYVVKRLKSGLSHRQKQALVTAAERYLAKPYDLYFEWDDRAIYCSEIVWKAYAYALGIELAPLQKLQQFRLADAEVQALMKKRYGQRIPLNETVISPQAIFQSKALVEVARQ